MLDRVQTIARPQILKTPKLVRLSLLPALREWGRQLAGVSKSLPDKAGIALGRRPVRWVRQEPHGRTDRPLPAAVRSAAVCQAEMEEAGESLWLIVIDGNIPLEALFEDGGDKAGEEAGYEHKSFCLKARQDFSAATFQSDGNCYGRAGRRHLLPA